MQTEIDLLLVLAFGSLALVLGTIGFLAWVVASVVGDLAAAVSPVQRGETLAIADVEAHLDSLDHERFVDSGVVQAVTAERRRPGRLPFALARDPREGLRVDVAVPTPLGETATEWFPVPDRLDGDSRFERLLAANDVPHRNVAELVGAEVPIEKVGGQWRIAVQEPRHASVARAVERLRAR